MRDLKTTERILMHVHAHGGDVTSRELATLMGTPVNTVTARIADLRRVRMLRPSGTTSLLRGRRPSVKPRLTLLGRYRLARLSAEIDIHLER